MPHYDLVVLGAGSGNALFTPEVQAQGWRTAIVEPSRFGGTCLNRGCIPSKMFVVAADFARAPQEAGRLGIHLTLDRADWPAVRNRVWNRIDPIHDAGVAYRRSTGVDVYTAPARFVRPKVLDVGGEEVSADRMVIAVGSRPVVPPIPGIDQVDHHTSDTIMRLDRVPYSLAILGGGFIAAEMGHVFEAFGSRVTIVQRGDRLLPAEDEAIAAAFTVQARERFDVRLGTTISRVEPAAGGVVVHLASARGEERLEVETLLLAAGRVPNTDILDCAAGGIDLDAHGHVVTGDTYATNVAGVWALGDAANHFQLKHMANAEQRTVAHNLVHPDRPKGLAYGGLAPHAVFTDPQIAGVGLTEQEARAQGIDAVVVTRAYAETAYGWALEDTASFVKLLADRATRTLLGAHIIGPHAALLLQPLLQGMHLANTVDQLAREVLYVHPALTEVVEQALLDAVAAMDQSVPA